MTPTLSSYLAAAQHVASREREGERYIQSACTDAESFTSNPVVLPGAGDAAATTTFAAAADDDETRKNHQSTSNRAAACKINGIPSELRLRYNSKSPSWRPLSVPLKRQQSEESPTGWVDHHPESITATNDGKQTSHNNSYSHSIALDDAAAGANNHDENGKSEDNDNKSTGSMPSLVSFLGNSVRSQASSTAASVSGFSSSNRSSVGGLDFEMSFSTIPSINTIKTFGSGESGIQTVKTKNYIPGVVVPKKDKRWET
ncbi:MAG: hypothetical protein SGILL_005509 [Bacillariaceae sp.]